MRSCFLYQHPAKFWACSVFSVGFSSLLHVVALDLVSQACASPRVMQETNMEIGKVTVFSHFGFYV